MTCTCVDSVNEKLATRNTRLSQAMMFSEAAHPGLMLETEQIEKGRGKPKACAIFLTYCPFCGTKYAEDAHMESNGTHDLSTLMQPVPDGWFLDGAFHQHTAIIYKGEKHRPLPYEQGPWLVRLQHTDGGKLTEGRGKSMVNAWNAAVVAVMQLEGGKA